jgi:hypothetical protein
MAMHKSGSFVLFIWFVWLNETNRLDEIDQMNQFSPSRWAVLRLMEKNG